MILNILEALSPTMNHASFRCPFHVFVAGTITGLALHYFYQKNSSKQACKNSENKKEDRGVPKELLHSKYDAELSEAVRLAGICGDNMMQTINDLDKEKVDKSVGKEGQCSDCKYFTSHKDFLHFIMLSTKLNPTN